MTAIVSGPFLGSQRQPFQKVSEGFPISGDHKMRENKGGADLGQLWQRIAEGKTTPNHRAHIAGQKIKHARLAWARIMPSTIAQRDTETFRGPRIIDEDALTRFRVAGIIRAGERVK